ncbi:MAG: NFACT family protein, partial [Prochlorococcaceae cyanobacterium]
MAPLQALDVTSLKAVLAELRATLLPARFEKAQQRDSHTVQLGLRSLSGRPWLELSWQAEAPRLLAIPPPPRQGEGSTLAQQLQHGLRGLALVALEQQGWERVVTLAFAERPGAAISRRLVVELMGRHSNLFLLEASGRVMAIGRQVRERQSRLRPIGNGDSYLPPPPLAGDPPERQESFASWQRRLKLLPQPLGEALRQSYQGVSPALARQLLQGSPAAHSPAADSPDALLLQPVEQITATCWQHLFGRW